jgi:hypothetical protein
VSISDFVRLPAAAGLRRVRAPAIVASAARTAPVSPARPRSPLPVLRLTCTLTGDQVDGLVPAVLARLAGFRRVGTVVLELDRAAVLDCRARQALCGLRALLDRRGTDLRLVITSRQTRDDLAAAAEHRIGPDVVHDSPRAAMLAAYALLPGPGLVDAGMRAALAAPPATL